MIQFSIRLNDYQGLVELLQTCLGVSTVQENHFQYCGGAVNLVRACLSVGKVGESRFNHGGGRMNHGSYKLFQVFGGSDKAALWRCGAARTSLFKRQ